MNKHLVAIAVLLCGTAHASEWDLTYRPPLEPAQVLPHVQAPPTATTSWFASYTLDGLGSPLVRYDASGHVASYAFSELGNYAFLANSPDGGGVAALGWVSCSEMDRFDVNARKLWQRPVGDCGKIEVDFAGGLWTESAPPGVLVRYKADGTESLDVPLIGQHAGLTADFAADPADSAAYIAGVFDVAPIVGVGRASVERVAVDGINFWRWVDQEQELSRALEATVTSDGNVFAIGDVSVSEDTRLIGIKLSRTGQLLHLERSQDLVSVREEFGTGGGPGSLRAGTDGSAYALAHRIGDPLGSQVLVRYDTAGTIAWTRSLAPWTCGGCTSAASPGGGIALLLSQGIDPGNSPMTIRRFAADGSSDDVPAHALGPYNDFQRYLATGEFVPLETTLPAAPVRKLIASAQDAAGDTYLLARTKTGQQLDKLGADGSVAWSVDIDADSSNGTLRVANGRACAYSTYDNVVDPNPYPPFVTCVDAANGSNQAQQRLPNPAQIAQVTLDSIGVAGIADVVLVYHNPDRTERLTYTGSGWTRKYLRDQFATRCIAQDDTGRDLLLGIDQSADPAERAVAFEPDGSLRYDVPIPGDPCTSNPRLLADGSALLLGVGEGDAPPTVVNLLGTDGTPRWTRALQGLNWGWTAVAGDAVYVAQASLDYSAPDGPVSGRVTKLGLADGQPQWVDDFDDFGKASPRVFASPNWILYTITRDNGLRFRVVDAFNGAQLSEDAKSCGGAGCEFERIELDAQQRLQVSAWRDLDAQQGGFAFYRADHPFALGSPRARADQSVLDGVWYSAGSTGQGLVLDYLDAAHTAFLSWFTFTQAGGLALGEQRWYTLQGSVPADAGTVSLDIFENTGGRFAQGPVTTAAAVGHATLSFPGCGSAVLSYAFDPEENGGASGVLGLQALTPSGSACGLIGAAPITAPASAANGFDTRQSGTWYDPAASGQGFSFVVRPGTQGGYVFGAWYTYDPAGSADDPTAQHWFTLQGDVATATNGTVALTISRTIGGTFDYGATRDTYRVGTANLHFVGCGTATLDYQFDQSEVAAAFAGLSGHLNLTGLGTCP